MQAKQGYNNTLLHCPSIHYNAKSAWRSTSTRNHVRNICLHAVIAVTFKIIPPVLQQISNHQQLLLGTTQLTTSMQIDHHMPTSCSDKRQELSFPRKLLTHKIRLSAIAKTCSKFHLDKLGRTSSENSHDLCQHGTPNPPSQTLPGHV